MTLQKHLVIMTLRNFDFCDACNLNMCPDVGYIE